MVVKTEIKGFKMKRKECISKVQQETAGNAFLFH